MGNNFTGRSDFEAISYVDASAKKEGTVIGTLVRPPKDSDFVKASVQWMLDQRYIATGIGPGEDYSNRIHSVADEPDQFIAWVFTEGTMYVNGEVPYSYSFAISFNKSDRTISLHYPRHPPPAVVSR